jgi:hypothetical protein
MFNLRGNSLISMIRVLLVLMWAALPSPGQVGSTALYTEFKHPPDPAVVQAIHEEVASLLEPGGLYFEWETLPLNDQKVWMELAVVTFEGHCEVLPFATNPYPDRRLGWTHVSEGEVLPFATVDCDAVRAEILRDLASLPPQSSEKVFGRAIGRVTAHELLHIFARTTHHSAHGVDQATLSQAELMADHLILDEHERGPQILRASRDTPSKMDAGSVQAGRLSFLHEGCNMCHGAEGQGTRRGPVLRVAGRLLNSVILAAKLTKSQGKMSQRARSLKVTQPSLTEDELGDLARFLSDTGH